MKKNIIAMIACLAVIANVTSCTNKKEIELPKETEEEYYVDKTPVSSSNVTYLEDEEIKEEEEEKLEFLEPVIIPTDSFSEIEKGEFISEEEIEEINYKYIALTFDDGPGKYTSDLLDILEEYDASATFFVVGQRLNCYEDELKDIVESGSEIGVHTYSHTSFTSLGVEGMLSEINKTRDILDEIGVEYTNLVRPPYGSLNDEIKNGALFPLILWNVDTRDWESKDAQKVCEEFLKGVTQGNIILLHDIHATTIEGVRLALSKVGSEYKFVSVSKLADITQTALEEGKTYYSLKLK